MTNNTVTTGVLGTLAQTLQSKLGRRVVVHRDEQTFKDAGGRLRKQIRYSVGIEGSNPPVFFNMTVSAVYDL